MFYFDKSKNFLNKSIVFTLSKRMYKYFFLVKIILFTMHQKQSIPLRFHSNYVNKVANN